MGPSPAAKKPSISLSGRGLGTRGWRGGDTGLLGGAVVFVAVHGGGLAWFGGVAVRGPRVDQRGPVEMGSCGATATPRPRGGCRRTRGLCGSGGFAAGGWAGPPSPLFLGSFCEGPVSQSGNWATGQ